MTRGTPPAPPDASVAALAGRGAVVTGASRGIGLAIARSLAAAGARVAMLARGADALAQRAAELGGAALPVPCDVSDAAAVGRAMQVITLAFGGAPDILVNNAGIFHPRALTDITPDDFASSIAVNLNAPFYLVHAVVPAMRARGAGHIVTIGSVADRVAYAGNGSYSPGKFGVRALHDVVREELRGTGVRATLVSPGPTNTDIWGDLAGTGRFPPRDAMLDAGAVADAVLYAVTRVLAVNVDELRLSAS
ncbi:MAG TPA: SDR family oxidoreductase [Gemmatimonadaceae bacterium]|nr:SDR family oxidoreductase [Gemmatimonadaceae bacterium]